MMEKTSMPVMRKRRRKEEEGESEKKNGGEGPVGLTPMGWRGTSARWVSVPLRVAYTAVFWPCIGVQPTVIIPEQGLRDRQESRHFDTGEIIPFFFLDHFNTVAWMVSKISVMV
jgi:hypothetical protein